MGAGYRMLSYGGNYTQDGLKKGMNENQAVMYGETMAGMETLMDTLGDKLKGVAIGKAKTVPGFKNFIKTGLKELGINATIEGLGEAVTEPIQELVATAFGGEADYNNIGERMWQSFLGGFASEALMTGASLGYGGSVNAYNKIKNGEQISLEELKGALKEIDEKNEVDLEKMLVNNFNFTADELYRNTDVQQNREQKLEGIAEELSNEEKRQIMINESDLDDTQKEVLSEIASQYNLSDEDVKKAIQNTKDGKYNNLEQIEGTTTQNNEVLNQEQQTIQDENKMAQNETSQEQRDLIQDLQKFNETRQEGQEIFDLNNEENVKEVQAIQKLAKNRNINITFDESRFDNADTNAFYEYDEKGNVANIVLNPNSTSKKYVQNLVIHEMTHSFEGSKEYNNLSKAILDYAKKTGEYDKAFQDLKNTYSSVYKGDNIDSIVEKEAVANILGEKLGDKEFVDSLVNNQYVERSTIQKIIDFVKNQINRFKGYKDQEAYWNHVKTLFEDAYNKSEVSQEGIKASVERNKLTDTRDSQGRQLSEGQVEYFKDSKVRDENGNLLEVYHGTPVKEDINVYDSSKAGSNVQADFTGIYFTDNIDFAEQFAHEQLEGSSTFRTKLGERGQLKKQYLNITNPLNLNELTDVSQVEKYIDEEKASEFSKEAMIETLKRAIANKNSQMIKFNLDLNKISQDYDGIIADLGGRNKGSNEYIVFNSNQIKNTDNLNPTTNDDTRYSVETEDLKTDNQGRELSKGQQEYFKNVSPELKDENGNLKRFYHGTNSDFTVFDLSKGGQSNSGASIGFWFTETKEGAEKFANDVWYGDKKPNTKEVYLDIKNPKIYENVKNEEQEQFYKDKSEKLEKKAKELKKKYSWDNTDYKTAMTFDSLIRDYHYARIKNESVDLDMFERLAEGRGFSKEQISEMKNDATEYDKIIAESKEAENEYYKLHYNDAYEQFKIDLYEVAGQSAEEANTGGLGMALNNPKETVEKFRQKLMAEGYDGIIIKGTQFDRGNFNGENNQYVIFNSNQAKNIDNENPTTNPDIRYSQDTTGAWNNFIEKYFKNEGEGTAIKDLKKLPTREYTIQDYEEVINNSANIPEADKTAILKDLEGIKLNKQSLNDFKQYVEDLDKNYKEVAQEQEQQRFENKNYKDEGRAELISKKRKEFNKSMDYDDSVVAELDEIIPRNRNGKRTVSQWKDMAKQLGQRIANLSPEQIEDIAVKSYYDLEPTKAITRYDNKSKTNVGYEQLYANDWVNEVYEGVRENRQFSMETENQENQPTQKELPKAETQLPTRDTSLEEDIEAFRQETRKVTDKTKGRKHLETYATSESVGKEGRKVARELYKSEQYVPISNRETMTKANTKIQTGGVENTYTELTNRFKTNEKMTLQDIATGERLIQIYSAQGDYAKVNELMQDVAILGTELGQQVQALSIIKKASPEGQLQLLNRLVERTNNKQNTDIKITDEQAEKILKSKNKEELDNNVSEVTLELAQQLPITMKDKIRSWRYLSMLGNPRTHIRNIVGNVAMNVLQNTKNKVAGAGEDIASIFNKNLERTKTFKGATKEQKAYAKADSYIMENVLENGGKYSAETLLDQNKRQFDNKILNKIADINSSLLEKEDTVFLRTAYRQALQGYMSANKITPQEMENNPKIANKARQYAIEQAQEATFHQFNALASTLNQIEEKGGVASALTSAILPFKKTPLNIAKTGIEYSPINIMRAVGGTISDITQTNKDLQSQLNKGKITQEEYNSEISSIVNNRIDQMAKGLTGTALGVLGYALSKMGVLKATNKDDEDEFEESLGKQEFSIQIGDNTYSLDWLAPTAIPLFIGANIQELFNETGKELNEEGEEKSFYDRVGDTLNTTVTGLTQAFEPMTEMSMLQGLASALSSYEQDSSNKIFDIGASALQSYAGQFVPTALGQVAKTIDPVVRDTSSTKKGFAKKVDQLKRQTTAKIPFASKTLPSKSDVWGEEKTRADNILQRFVETAVLPYNREKVIDDMTSEQLKDVFRETGESGTLPKNPQKYFTVNKQKYNLTSEEYNNAKKIYGKTAKSILDDVTKTQQYKDLDKDIKVKLLKDIYSYAKEEIKVDYSNKKKLDYEPKVNNSANKYKTIQTYKQNKNIEELLKLYNKD